MRQPPEPGPPTHLPDKPEPPWRLHRRKSGFTKAQPIRILKQAEGGAEIAALARGHGVSAPTSDDWRGKYGEPQF